MQSELSRSEQFRAFAASLLPDGWSGNAILSAARELGFGLNRQAALGVISGVRADIALAAERPSTLGELPGLPGVESTRWGELVQQTDQWLRSDGPNAIMFQNTGAQPNEWLDYVIVPEDEEFISQRLVIEDEEYVDPDNPNSGYRTSQSMPADISPAEAARRIGVDPARVARVIFDRP